jgi:hypothetical protein
MKAGRDFRLFFKAETLHGFFDFLNAQFGNLPAPGRKCRERGRTPRRRKFQLGNFVTANHAKYADRMDFSRGSSISRFSLVCYLLN